MGALARTQSSDCSNPVLDLYTLANGVLTDVYSLTYQIWDNTTGTPVQVYPDGVGGKQAVDVATACPTGDKISTGHYVARWDVPEAANVGTWQVRWYIKLTASVAEQVYIEDFEVLPEIVGSGSYPDEDYCLVADLRAEGVPASYSDAYLQTRITLASRFIERATKRRFYAKSKTLRLNGRGGRILLLNEPIIAVTSVTIDVSPYSPAGLALDSDMFRVYNRHLSQGLIEPDDRNNPKIEIYYPVDQYHHTRLRGTRFIFPEGQQNVEVTGVFGYTDPDPDAANTQGKTPDLIKHVCKLIVMRQLPTMASGDRFDALNRNRITSEKTRDQSYTLAPYGAQRAGAGAGFTGDPEIESILASFMRPPALGAA